MIMKSYEYYCKLLYLLKIANQEIRKLFEIEYQAIFESRWFDDSGITKVHSVTSDLKNPFFKDLIDQGPMNWNAWFKMELIKKLCEKKDGLVEHRKEIGVFSVDLFRAMDEIVGVELIVTTKKQYAKEDFEKLYSVLAQALTVLCPSEKEVYATVKEGPVPKEIGEFEILKANDLREQGNHAYSRAEYSNAISLYKKAVELKIPKYDYSIIYSNVSISYIKIYELEGNYDCLLEAEYYALLTILYAPNWYRGYVRMASAIIPMKTKDTFSILDIALLRDIERLEIWKIRISEGLKYQEDLCIKAGHKEDAGTMIKRHIFEMTGDVKQPVTQQVSIMAAKAYIERDDIRGAMKIYREIFKHRIEPESILGYVHLLDQVKEKDKVLQFGLLMHLVRERTDLIETNKKEYGRCEYELGKLFGIEILPTLKNNVDKQLHWLHRALDNGISEAAVDLGDIYSGIDLNLADQYYQFAGYFTELQPLVIERRGILSYRLKIYSTCLGLIDVQSVDKYIDPKYCISHLFSKKEYVRMEEKSRRLLGDLGVLKWESEHRLSPFLKEHDRIRRFMELDPAEDFIEQPYIYFNKLSLLPLKEKSKTAQRLLKSIEYLEKIPDSLRNKYLDSSKNEGLTQSFDEWKLIISNLAKTIKHLDPLEIYLSSKKSYTFPTLLEELCICFTRKTDNGLDQDLAQLEQDFLIVYQNDNNNFQELLVLFSNAIKKYPNNNDLVFYRGVINRKLGNFKEALADFNILLLKDPMNLTWLYSKAETLYHSADYLDSIKIFESFQSLAHKDHEKLPESYYYIGSSYYHMNKIEETLENYKMGLDSEKVQLSIYKPYRSLVKLKLDRLLTQKHLVKPNDGVEDSKYNPLRMYLFNLLNEGIRYHGKKPVISIELKNPPAKGNETSLRISDIQYSKPAILEDFKFELEIISKSIIFEGGSVIFLTQDSKKECIPVYLNYSVSSVSNLSLNSKILLFNPIIYVSKEPAIPFLLIQSESNITTTTTEKSIQSPSQ